MITALPRVAIAMNDFDAALRLFRDGLGMPVLDFSEDTVPSLGAHVGMCAPDGGSMVELMAPANPDLPLSQALEKFLDVRGEGFYAMMLEAADPDAEAEVLAGRGLGVLPLMAGAGGRDVHPKSTHGVLVRVYPNGSVSAGTRPGGEPGLSGIERTIVAVDDASIAAEAYGPPGFGLDLGEVIVDDERGVEAVICTPPKGGVVELAAPTDTQKPFAEVLEKQLKDRGPGLHALVLHADDPAGAAEVLADRGLEPTEVAGRVALDVFGARFLIEQRPA